MPDIPGLSALPEGQKQVKEWGKIAEGLKELDALNTAATDTIETLSALSAGEETPKNFSAAFVEAMHAVLDAISAMTQQVEKIKAMVADPERNSHLQNAQQLLAEVKEDLAKTVGSVLDIGHVDVATIAGRRNVLAEFKEKEAKRLQNSARLAFQKVSEDAAVSMPKLGK